MYINSIGIRRAACIIGLMNLTYNMYHKTKLSYLRPIRTIMSCRQINLNVTII